MMLYSLPPGSIARVDNNDDQIVVRFPDGTGWWCIGSWSRDDAETITRTAYDGWEWGAGYLGADIECQALATGLSNDECHLVAAMDSPAVHAWLKLRGPGPGPVASPASTPTPVSADVVTTASEKGLRAGYLVGTGVIVIHRPPAGPPRTLLCQRLAGASDGEGAWSCPGGCVDPDDEGIVAAALRELREETGIDVAAGDSQARLLQVVKEGRRSATGQRYVTLFCEVVFDTVEPPVTEDREPHKHGPWQRFTADEIAERVRDGAATFWDGPLLAARLLFVDPLCDAWPVYRAQAALELLQHSAGAHVAIDAAIQVLLGPTGYAAWLADRDTP